MPNSPSFHLAKSSHLRYNNSANFFLLKCIGITKNRMASKAKRVISELFNLFMDEPTVLPDEWRYLGKENLKNNKQD